MPVKVIIHQKRQLEQDAFRVQTMHLAYKNGIWRTKLAFRLQICSFQFTNKHLALQTGVSDYNSAVTKRFDKVEQSKRGKLLMNSILADIDSMGHAISEQEKRQILMEVLKKMC